MHICFFLGWNLTDWFVLDSGTDPPGDIMGGGQGPALLLSGVAVGSDFGAAGFLFFFPAARASLQGFRTCNLWHICRLRPVQEDRSLWDVFL